VAVSDDGVTRDDSYWRRLIQIARIARNSLGAVKHHPPDPKAVHVQYILDTLAKRVGCIDDDIAKEENETRRVELQGVKEEVLATWPKLKDR